MAGKAKQTSLEGSMSDLETLLNTLENEDLPLETAMALYQKGKDLLKSCYETLDQVEKNMLVVHDNEEAGKDT